MAFYPVITRIYSPDAFGLLGTFMATLAVITPVAALTYPIAIVLPESDADAKNLAKLSAVISTVVATIIAIILLLGGGKIADTLNLQAIESFLFLIPLAMLFAAFHQILKQWLIRKKQFKITARMAVLHALTLNSAKVGIGWFHPVGTILVVLATLGNALHASLLWLGIRKQPEAHPELNKPSTDLKTLAMQHRDFPMYRAPEATLNALSQNLPIMMLATFFGPASAGFYTLSKQAMGVPTNLMGNAVGDVFYPRITEAAKNNENLFGLLFKATMALASIGLIPFGIVAAFGPTLFDFVFGSEWVTAGEYARWLAIWLYFVFMNIPSIKAIPVLSMQGVFLGYTVISVLVRFSALAAGYALYESDTISIAFFGLSGAFLNLSIIFIVLLKSFQFNRKRDIDG